MCTFLLSDVPKATLLASSVVSQTRELPQAKSKARLTAGSNLIMSITSFAEPPKFLEGEREYAH